MNQSSSATHRCCLFSASSALGWKQATHYCSATRNSCALPTRTCLAAWTCSALRADRIHCAAEGQLPSSEPQARLTWSRSASDGGMCSRPGATSMTELRRWRRLPFRRGKLRSSRSWALSFVSGCASWQSVSELQPAQDCAWFSFACPNTVVCMTYMQFITIVFHTLQQHKSCLFRNLHACPLLCCFKFSLSSESTCTSNAQPMTHPFYVFCLVRPVHGCRGSFKLICVRGSRQPGLWGFSLCALIRVSSRRPSLLCSSWWDSVAAVLRRRCAPRSALLAIA